MEFIIGAIILMLAGTLIANIVGPALAWLDKKLYKVEQVVRGSDDDEEEAA